MKRFGLIGYPLTHSFSQKYFSNKFEQEGLTDHVYELFPIASVDLLPEVLRKHHDLVGLNVTIPHKIAVLPFLDESRLPGNMQATNCVKIVEGRLIGFNTDVIGFERSFVPQLKAHHRSALVLGNGGATAAVTFVLNKLNIPYQVVSRKLHEGSTLTYEMLNAETIANNNIIINTTPLGTFPNVHECADIPYEFLTNEHYLFDLIYNPAKTMFLQKGEEKGAAIKNGYEMLVIQAEESWKLWTT